MSEDDAEKVIENIEGISHKRDFPKWWRVVRELAVAVGIIAAIAMFWLTYSAQRDQHNKFQAERRTELVKYLYDVDAKKQPLANARLRSEAFAEFLALERSVWGLGATVAGANLQDTSAGCLRITNVDLDGANTSNVFWSNVLIENSRIFLGPGMSLDRAVIRNSFITIARAEYYVDEDQDVQDGEGYPGLTVISDSYISDSHIYSPTYEIDGAIMSTFFKNTKLTKRRHDNDAIREMVKNGLIEPLQILEEITMSVPDGFRFINLSKVFDCENCDEETSQDTTFTESQNYMALTEREWAGLVQGDPSAILSNCQKRDWDIY